MDQGFARLSAVIQFPSNSQVCRQPLEVYNCTVELIVKVYNNECADRCPLCTSSKLVKFNGEQGRAVQMRIEVDKVVNLKDIVLIPDDNVCPDYFYFEITARLCANKIRISVADSGCDDFVSVKLETSDPNTDNHERLP